MSGGSASFSKLAIGLVLTLVIGWSLAKHRHWQQPISWDAFGYYLYLPAILIHHDVAIKDPAWFDELFDRYDPSATVYQFNYMDDGGRAIKYPIGLAMLWLPFFLIAHFLAGLLDLPQDGMSAIYQWAMVIGSWCYFLLGLVWLRKVLLHAFGDRVAAITIILLVIGSNVLYMTVFDPLMPHMFLFSLYAGIIWYTIRWHERPSLRSAAMIGTLIGIAIACRNTEFIILLIPLLWGIKERGLRGQVRLMGKFPLHFSIAAVLLVLMCVPQLLYWKYVTGDLFYISYTNAGEGLDLHRPHILKVLFSFRKGVFIYTPLIGIAFLGVFFLRRWIPRGSHAIIIYLMINLWVVSSWTIWWYADSFGNRGLVQSYAVLALPLASLIAGGLRSRSRVVLSVVAAMLVLFCMFQTWQATSGILHSSRMTKKAYFKVFGRTERPADLEQYLIVQREYDGTVSIPDLSRYRQVAVVHQTFDTPEPGFPAERYAHWGGIQIGNAFKIDTELPWNAAIGDRYGAYTNSDHLYARYSLKMFIPAGAPHPDAVIVIAMEHDGRKYGELLRGVTPDELVPGRWNDLTVWYVTPTIRDTDDLLRAYVWLRQEGEVYVDEAVLEVYELLEQK